MKGNFWCGGDGSGIPVPLAFMPLSAYARLARFVANSQPPTPASIKATTPPITPPMMAPMLVVEEDVLSSSGGVCVSVTLFDPGEVVGELSWDVDEVIVAEEEVDEEEEVVEAATPIVVMTDGVPGSLSVNYMVFIILISYSLGGMQLDQESVLIARWHDTKQPEQQ